MVSLQKYLLYMFSEYTIVTPHGLYLKIPIKRISGPKRNRTLV